MRSGKAAVRAPGARTGPGPGEGRHAGNLSQAASDGLFYFYFRLIVLLFVFIYLCVRFLLTEASVKDILMLNSTLGMLLRFSTFELVFFLVWSSVRGPRGSMAGAGGLA